MRYRVPARLKVRRAIEDTEQEALSLLEFAGNFHRREDIWNARRQLLLKAREYSASVDRLSRIRQNRRSTRKRDSRASSVKTPI